MTLQYKNTVEPDMLTEADLFDDDGIATIDKDRFEKDLDPDAHRDPITGTPGAHPVGAGVGAAGGAAAGGVAGWAVGAAAGAAVSGPAAPLGALVGGILGAVAGGLAGKGVAESVNPTSEEFYWNGRDDTRSFSNPNFDSSHYQSAYRYGWESHGKHDGKSFDEAEAELMRDWDNQRGESTLDWAAARAPAQDAWNRASHDADLSYWRENYIAQPYYQAGFGYDDYEPAYHYGGLARRHAVGKSWEEVEDELGAGWDQVKAKSRLDWENAKLAARDAWNRAKI